MVRPSCARLAGPAYDFNLTMSTQANADRIWCARFDRDRRELLPLFRLADDSEQRIQSYLHRGDVLFAAESGQVLGHALVLETEASEVFELRSIAVLESRQGQGVGSLLVRAVIRYCRTHNAKSLRVSTSIADANAIRFYLRQGFRALAIVRDAFTKEQGYPKYSEGNIPLNDAIELELDLRSFST